MAVQTPLQITFQGMLQSDALETLEIGDPVRFVAVEGEKGPRASTVHPIGKHHVVALE